MTLRHLSMRTNGPRLSLEGLESRLVPANAAMQSLLIYYAWPSLINGSNGDVSIAASQYAQYKHVVFGSALVDAVTHPDQANTSAIMNSPISNNTLFYGYITVSQGLPQSVSDAEIRRRIDKWDELGADGIFMDEYGFDYGTTRARQNMAVDYAHSKGMNVIANGWKPADVFGNSFDATFNPTMATTRLNAQDFYLSESYRVSNGALSSTADWISKSDAIKSFQKQIGFKVMSVTTSTETLPYSPELFSLAFHSAWAENHEAFGWGEPEFSASGAFNTVAPFRPRPVLSTEPPLVIDGTSGTDLISIVPVNGPGSDNQVLVNNSPVATIPLSQGLTVNLLAGNDQFLSNGNMYAPMSIYGADGNDHIDAGYGNDTIDGGNDNDTIFGNVGADSIRGGNGNDLLNGNSDDDTLRGQAGSDNLVGGTGNDMLIGGAQIDVFQGSDGFDTLTDRDPQETNLISIESVTMYSPRIQILNSIASEGNSGTSRFVEFQISLNMEARSAVSVRYSTQNLTATAGSDYIATAGIVNFAPGELSKTVRVPIVGDTRLESDESFRLLLTTPVGATLANSFGLGIIADDDTRNPFPFTLQVKQNWGTGFDAEINLRNVTSHPLRSWQMEFDAPFDITYIWGARIISRTGNRYIVESVPTSAYLASNGSTNWGFVGEPGSSTSITDIAIRGILVQR